MVDTLFQSVRSSCTDANTQVKERRTKPNTGTRRPQSTQNTRITINNRMKFSNMSWFGMGRNGAADSTQEVRQPSTTTRASHVSRCRTAKVDANKRDQYVDPGEAPHVDNDGIEHTATKAPLLTCRRFRSELYCCQPWFDTTERVNQRELDIVASFAPSSIVALSWKCFFCGFCVFTLVYSFVDDRPHAEFTLAHVTNWALVATSLYSIASVMNSVIFRVGSTCAPQPAAQLVNTRTTPGFCIRLEWVLFELAVHMEAMVTLLFWTLLFDPDIHIRFLPITTHGGLLALVLVDGFLVNRIPLRWMHYFGFILPIEMLYSVWTYIHYAAKIGNPWENDTDGNDDAIYPEVIRWDDDGWEKALAYSVGLVLVVGPLFFGLLWCISNGNLACRDRRRYLDHHRPAGNDEAADDVERPAAPAAMEELVSAFVNQNLPDYPVAL
jgi:hypothetical protein